MHIQGPVLLRILAANRPVSYVAVGEVDLVEYLYVLHQEFPDASGAPRLRRGFLAAVKLPEPGERTILGHEQTFTRTFEDRLRLLEATHANFGPVFVLYADAERRLAGFLDRIATLMDTGDKIDNLDIPGAAHVPDVHARPSAAPPRRA